MNAGITNMDTQTVAGSHAAEIAEVIYKKKYILKTGGIIIPSHSMYWVNAGDYTLI